MHQLKFTTVWYDDFNLEVIVEASNDSFSGKVELLLPYEKCFQMIDELQDFPKSQSDEVKFFSGDDFTHSTLGLHFYSRDSLGNPSILVSLQQKETQSPKNEINRTALVVHCDPQGIKNFRDQLRGLLTGKRTTASLEMI